MSDAEVVIKIREGAHELALKQLYAYFKPVKQLVIGNSGSLQDAEDIYQEGLIILFRKVKEPSFELRSTLNTFIYGICRLLWNEELKRRNKWPQHVADLSYLVMDEELDEALRNEEKFRKAEKAFLRIGTQCRELLHLFYFDKWSMQQIADKFGFSTERVAKNQKYRCMEKAREELKKINLEKIMS